MARLAGVHLGTLRTTYVVDESGQQGQRAGSLPSLIAFSDTGAPYVSDDPTFQLWLDYPDRCAPAFLRMLTPVTPDGQLGELSRWFPYEPVTSADEGAFALRVTGRNGERLIGAREVLRGYFQELSGRLGRAARTSIVLSPSLGPQAAVTVEEAARQAGIVGVMVGSTSTALAAYLSSKELFTNQIVAICTLSPTTFDLTVVYMGESSAYEVIGTAGDPTLGTFDIDVAVANWLDGHIRMGNLGEAWIDSNYIRARLLVEAMSLRQLLSTKHEASVLLPFLTQMDGRGLVHIPSSGRLTLDRTAVAAAAAPVLACIEPVCTQALRSLPIDRYDINELLVVSDQQLPTSTLEIMRHVFGHRPRMVPNAEQITAQGAVLLAQLDGRQRPRFGPLSVRSGAHVFATIATSQWAAASRLVQRQPVLGETLAADGTLFLQFYEAIADAKDGDSLLDLPELLLWLYRHGRSIMLQLSTGQRELLIAGLVEEREHLDTVASEHIQRFLVDAARSSVSAALERYTTSGVTETPDTNRATAPSSSFWSWFRDRRGS